MERYSTCHKTCGCGATVCVPISITKLGVNAYRAAARGALCDPLIPVEFMSYTLAVLSLQAVTFPSPSNRDRELYAVLNADPIVVLLEQSNKSEMKFRLCSTPTSNS